MSSTLFKSLASPDRSETRLAYEASYYPPGTLHSYHKVVWSKTLYLKKHFIEASLQDGLFWTRDGTFAIHWAYNNVPTEIEWKKLHDDTLFCVHLRISPLIKSHKGRIALLEIE